MTQPQETRNSTQQHMKTSLRVSGTIIKRQTGRFKREQVVPSSKSSGMRLCFPFSCVCVSSPIYAPHPPNRKRRVLLPGLPTSELHYYQQSAFKSAPAQHQDVFCMLIPGDTDPSLLCRSLMPGVPETAGKTVGARRAALQTENSGHHTALYSSVLCAQKDGCW